MGAPVSGQTGRAVVIAGAASGIGAATALRIARPGMRLMLHTGGLQGASQARLAAVVEHCMVAGTECATYVGDFALAGEATACVESELSRLGADVDGGLTLG